VKDNVPKPAKILPRPLVAAWRQIEQAENRFGTPPTKVLHIFPQRRRIPMHVPDQKSVAQLARLFFQRKETLTHHRSIPGVENHAHHPACLAAQLLGGTVRKISQLSRGLLDAFFRPFGNSHAISSRPQQDTPHRRAGDSGLTGNIHQGRFFHHFSNLMMPVAFPRARQVFALTKYPASNFDIS